MKSSLERFRDALYTCSAASCGFCREDCPIFAGVRKESTYARGISAIMLAYPDDVIEPNERLAKILSLAQHAAGALKGVQSTLSIQHDFQIFV